MATWTVSPVDQLCGQCSGVIPPNQPIALVTPARKVRCRTCATALGVAYDDLQVDDARFELERARRLEAERPLTPAQYVSRGRIAAPRPLTRASEIAKHLPFDPRMAAAGDRD